jgi:adenylate cyclase
MQHKLVEMRHKWEKEGKPPLHARCGINTGWMVVGNMGSETRFDYTVMGDSVNLGARLEPANKEYDTLIMIGDQTYQQTKDLIITRPLDLLQVKGKTEPVKVYELVATRETGISDEKKRVLDLFQKGFDNYLKQNWDWAINYFQQALAVQKDDGPSRRYLQRASMFKENPPGADWDGSFRMTTK